MLRNLSNGTFAPTINYAVGTGSTSIAAADLDGDGRTDLAVANSNGDAVSVVLTTCLP